MNTVVSENKAKRLLSLDVFRGLTVFCMILVNNGAGDQQFSVLTHSEWNGITPCDMVFPSFLFVVGVSIFLSLSKRKMSVVDTGESTLPLLKKIIVRTVLMFLIGVAIHACDMLVWGVTDIFPHLRWTGVLQRIAVCYGIASVVFLYVNSRYLWPIILSLLGVYGAMLWFFDGYDPSDANFANAIDRAVFGFDHLYHHSPIDPEGLPGCISSVAHTLIGVYVGTLLFDKSKQEYSTSHAFFLSSVMIVMGCVLSYIMPINKAVWSPSFVLFTCGMATCMLAMLKVLVDDMGHNVWCKLFQIFGLNALGLYVISEMLPSVFGRLGVYDAVWGLISSAIPYPCVASLCYALFVCSVMSFIAWLLWKNKIFIKL
ncbi:MAG: DUF5009 domain-containing protein [Bacteroidales bacterium]|nr:DUF5009 domain-containing protein [Bacteroidales bacterium]